MMRRDVFYTLHVCKIKTTYKKNTYGERCKDTHCGGLRPEETKVSIDLEHEYRTIKISLVRDIGVKKAFYLDLVQVNEIRDSVSRPIIINTPEFVMKINTCKKYCGIEVNIRGIDKVKSYEEYGDCTMTDLEKTHYFSKGDRLIISIGDEGLTEYSRESTHLVKG